MIEVYNEDCVSVLRRLEDESVDLFVTSPPYNLGIKYNSHNDEMDEVEYRILLLDVFFEINRVMKNNGSFFLNAGGTNKDPWRHYEIAVWAKKYFVLQNEIVWVKSISIENDSYGHFKPINSPRYLNHTHEFIYHFTKSGNVEINRKSIGVPFMDKSNINRWKGTEDLRCRGNSWFIPYETIQAKDEKGGHPAIFPKQLVEWCIKLHGYNPETVVCDPFMGTGTTLIVAESLGVKGIGIEIDSGYVEYFKKRRMS